MRHALVLVLAAMAGTVQSQPPPRSLLLANGTLVDGTGAPSRSASVRIRGDRIVEIGPSLQPMDGDEVIDVAGLTVAPGFIDLHSHADRGLEEHPDAESQVMQGITTALVGQDGGSELPIADFFERIERLRPAINYTTSVGHGTVRSVVMGGDFKRAATAAEIETMKALVDRGMRDGAVGLSSGLEYDPGFYAKPEELVEVARAAAAHGGFYSSHVRDEENEAFEAWREAIDVGRKARMPVQISHIKLASKSVWGRAAEAVALLESAAREELDVRADWYPYTYWQSSIYVLIPDRDFENRAKWEKGLDEIGGARNVLITNYRPDPSFNGRTVAEVAQSTGKDYVTTIIEMIRAAGPGIGIIGTSMSEDDLARFAAHPQVLICSDGGLTGRHPRGYGAFPRVLGRFVRERGLLSLEAAVSKMTSRSADRLGMRDRGQLAAGRFADVVVFDPKTIVDRGTPQEPSLAPVGMRHVIVNGEVVLRDGRPTGARPGRGLRRDAPAPR
jgi:N-acyl-D-amino-acid deacylase